MRISTNGAFRQGVSMMQQLQAALGRTQRQIATGQRILSPADDPIASARTQKLRESVSRLDQFERNGNIVTNRLSFEESALSDVNNVLQRVRELSIQANNATQSNESRNVIAIEMREHLDSLLQLANQRDGNGRYLFSGNMDDTVPVTRNGPQFTYNGDQGRRLIQIGDSRQIADGDSGADVFFRVRDGNGQFSVSVANTNSGTGVIGTSSVTDTSLYNQGQYTIRFTDPDNYEILDASLTLVSTGTFQSGDAITFNGIQFNIDGEPATGDEFVVAPSAHDNVFAVIEKLSAAVGTSVDGGTARARLNNGINTGILAIDQAIGNVIDTRTQVGSRLAAVESQNTTNATTVLTLQETIAGLQDLDYAEALSRLSIQSATLEAAQQSFIRTQSLSLFNFL